MLYTKVFYFLRSVHWKVHPLFSRTRIPSHHDSQVPAPELLAAISHHAPPRFDDRHPAAFAPQHIANTVRAAHAHSFRLPEEMYFRAVALSVASTSLASSCLLVHDCCKLQ